MFFKGYVETKDKKSIEKIKGRADFKTFEEVQSLPEYAGILAADTILVDIDDFEMSETLFRIVKHFKLACRVYKTTRGKHFLSSSSGTRPIKAGSSNALPMTKSDT